MRLALLFGTCCLLTLYVAAEGTDELISVLEADKSEVQPGTELEHTDASEDSENEARTHLAGCHEQARVAEVYAQSDIDVSAANGFDATAKCYDDGGDHTTAKMMTEKAGKHYVLAAEKVVDKHYPAMAAFYFERGAYCYKHHDNMKKAEEISRKAGKYYELAGEQTRKEGNHDISVSFYESAVKCYEEGQDKESARRAHKLSKAKNVAEKSKPKNLHHEEVDESVL